MLLVVTTISFALVLLLPGSPVDFLIGEGPDPELIERLEKELGLGRPIYVQYFDWLTDVFRGDLHYSIRAHQPVTAELKNRIPVTLELGIFSLLLS